MGCECLEGPQRGGWVFTSQFLWGCSTSRLLSRRLLEATGAVGGVSTGPPGGWLRGLQVGSC